MTIKTETAYSDDNFSLKFQSEILDNEKLDTKVIIDDNNCFAPIFTIAGDQTENFKNDFIKLMNKYRI